MTSGGNVVSEAKVKMVDTVRLGDALTNGGLSVNAAESSFLCIYLKLSTKEVYAIRSTVNGSETLFHLPLFLFF